MEKQWDLPAGVDLATVAAYADAMERKRHREWNRRNPDKVLAQRMRTYRNFLVKHGFTVIPPDGGAADE